MCVFRKVCGYERVRAVDPKTSNYQTPISLLKTLHRVYGIDTSGIEFKDFAVFDLESAGRNVPNQPDDYDLWFVDPNDQDKANGLQFVNLQETFAVSYCSTFSREPKCYFGERVDSQGVSYKHLFTKIKK